PRKYLLVTMFVALIDQDSGNSTPRCSKFTVPWRQFVMTTSRFSHATSSYGCTPSVVNTRWTFSPLRAPLPDRFFDVLAASAPTVSVMTPTPAIGTKRRRQSSSAFFPLTG